MRATETSRVAETEVASDRPMTVDTVASSAIMTPDEVARYLRKSTSWVYKNWQMLGGVKLRGSLFFPRKEDLYERLFSKEQGLEIRLHHRPRAIHGGMVQDQAASQAGRGPKKGGSSQRAEQSSDANRHGLLRTDKSKA